MKPGRASREAAPLFLDSSDAEVVMTEVANWHVLSTRSQWEQQVHDHLACEGFDVYLPRTRHWTAPDGAQRLCGAPLFPGFLFLKHALDRGSYETIRRTRGLIAVLGNGWERAAVLPDSEMLAIRRLVDSGIPSQPHAFLRAGQRVRVSRGALAGIEGILARSRPEKEGLFVLSFPVLQRSVAVELDRAVVEPIGPAVVRPAAVRREADLFLPPVFGPQAA
jgi:transcription antitermination factor NusG